MNIINASSLTLFLILLNTFFINAQVAKNPEDVSPLLIGEKLPDKNLVNDLGETINLNAEIKKKKTVLVFYRGGWCPYCNIQLSSLATSEADIIKLGYQIIAVSPDDFKNLKPTIEDDNINYKVYSDPEAKFIQQMGIAFSASSNTKSYISKKTIGKTTEILPVPSVFVVNTKGEIVFEYISPNYKKRISQELLLSVLKNVN